MKSRDFFLLFIFGVFIFLLPSVAEAGICHQTCNFYAGECGYLGYGPGAPTGVDRVGTIGSIPLASVGSVLTAVD